MYNQSDPPFMRFTLLGFDENTDVEEPDALSSPGPHSSPIPYQRVNISQGTQFTNLPDLPDDDQDSNYSPDPQTPIKRTTALSNEQKTRMTLAFMRDFNRFSLHQFLQTLFTSDDAGIKNFANTFLAGDGVNPIMDLLWKGGGELKNPKLTAWVVEKAALACAKEASWLSDCASEGEHQDDAKYLHVSSRDVNVKMINNFRIDDLRVRYDRVTPHLQAILNAIIARDKKILAPGSRDPDAGRTLITSMVLNLRSRRLNYHAALNALLFWDNHVPKRLVQAFNHFGITTSYPFQGKSITALSKDVILLARRAANDSQKIKLLPYDNFNWISKAWEATALHGSITHDEVSALLVILPTPEGQEAAKVTSLD
ncbi:uncharacterized protein LACBIDRAFT_300406 [Laccaria bicolor S238N-H82]|uniref:Predicted protein n=1 Tax=Laccaria bicolor (strain S238N-H82 / ATCC MYA-4686) TaxID=486041 RepID=B0DGP4_LACBS|nr:uncharacterized protein LACBIDRAFT_300406 [Laccaria bicolor S238N-H82]EDR06304.1 predicted protein [Laccaria bicolor S238N-H82]|eukprot:XP_001883165.1 predicted protein [Laccaria bicolor S238N-H82]